jgi:hypothetical protein
MSRSCATLYFYGDGRLCSNNYHGHFTHRPSRSGGVVCEYGNPPACLDDWTAILPYVTFDPSDRAQRVSGQAVEQGQGMGVARYRRIGVWCILAMWDRTGDVRGNSVAIFYTRDEIGAAKLLERVQGEYPELWRRITRLGGVRVGGPSDPDPSATAAPMPTEGQEVVITLDDAAPGMWERIAADMAKRAAEPTSPYAEGVAYADEAILTALGTEEQASAPRAGSFAALRSMTRKR